MLFIVGDIAMYVTVHFCHCKLASTSVLQLIPAAALHPG